MKIKHLGVGFAAGAAAWLVSPGEVAAQGMSASAAALLEEVVVTARRREESLADLPISVAAISADAMRAQGVYDIKDVTEVVPNVAFRDQDRRGRVSIFIRGIGTGGPGAFRPGGAGLYLDGHYLPGNNGQVMSTLDMERVEVLRGPQGTLFGKNTTGGAIQLITAKPQPEFGSEILLRAGDFGQQDFRGMVNIPINDTIASRFAFAKETQDGYYFNRTLNRDYGATDVEAISAALRFTPNDNWLIDLLFRGDYDDSDNHGGTCRAYPTQAQVDNLANLHPGGIDQRGRTVLPGSDPLVWDPVTQTGAHPPQIWNGPVYADGVGQWGGDSRAFGGDLTGANTPDTLTWGNVGDARGTRFPSWAAGRPRVNIGGHVERLYPGATLDFWENCETDRAMGDFVTSSEKDGFFQQDQNFYSATIQWDSNGEIGGLDNLNVKFIGGRMTQQTSAWGDRDYTPLSIDSIGQWKVGKGHERDTESMEVLFTADVNDRVSFVTGAHWFYDDAQLGDQNCRDQLYAGDNFNTFLNDTVVDYVDLDGPLAPRDVLTWAGNFNVQCFHDGAVQFDRLGDATVGRGPIGVAGRSALLTNEAVAVFGQVNFQINDDWALDFGARWTEEDREFVANEFNTGVSPQGLAEHGCVHDVPHFLDNPNLPRAPDRAWLEARGLATSNPGARPRTELCAPQYWLNYETLHEDGFVNNVRATFSEVTPMVSLTRSLAPGDRLESGILYGTISEGFLTGAFNDELNVNLAPSLAPLLTYGPEFVTNYEFGFKGTLADGRVRIAAAVFFMDYEDKQEEVEIDNSDGRFGGDPQVAIVTNASTVDIYGVEFELRTQPWDGGFLSLDVGYLSSEYGEYSAFDPDSPTGTVDNSNLTIEDYSPEWTVMATIEHAFLLGNGASLTPQLSMYAQSDYDFVGSIDINGPPSVCNQDSFATFRARLTYEPADAQWQASLFGDNITDERYFDFCDTARAGAYDYRYARPDTWGAEFVYRWGG